MNTIADLLEPPESLDHNRDKSMLVPEEPSAEEILGLASGVAPSGPTPDCPDSSPTGRLGNFSDSFSMLNEVLGFGSSEDRPQESDPAEGTALKDTTDSRDESSSISNPGARQETGNSSANPIEGPSPPAPESSEKQLHNAPGDLEGKPSPGSSSAASPESASKKKRFLPVKRDSRKTAPDPSKVPKPVDTNNDSPVQTEEQPLKFLVASPEHSPESPPVPGPPLPVDEDVSQTNPQKQAQTEEDTPTLESVATETANQSSEKDVKSVDVAGESEKQDQAEASPKASQKEDNTFPAKMAAETPAAKFAKQEWGDWNAESSTAGPSSSRDPVTEGNSKMPAGMEWSPDKEQLGPGTASSSHAGPSMPASSSSRPQALDFDPEWDESKPLTPATESKKEVENEGDDPEMLQKLAFVDIDPLPVIKPKNKRKYAPTGQPQQPTADPNSESTEPGSTTSKEDFLSSVPTEKSTPEPENPLYCKECDLVLQTQQTFQAHLSDPAHVRNCIRHEATLSDFVCRECDKDFEDKAALVRHRNEFHDGLPEPPEPPRVFHCRMCDVTMIGNECWLSHLTGRRHLNKDQATRRMYNLQPMASNVFPVSERADLVRRLRDQTRFGPGCSTATALPPMPEGAVSLAEEVGLPNTPYERPSNFRRPFNPNRSGNPRPWNPGPGGGYAGRSRPPRYAEPSDSSQGYSYQNYDNRSYNSDYSGVSKRATSDASANEEGYGYLNVAASTTSTMMADLFTCPLTKKIMREPVVLSIDGNTYERSAIEGYLRVHGASPANGRPVPEGHILVPNRKVAEAIEASIVGAFPPTPKAQD